MIPAEKQQLLLDKLSSGLPICEFPFRRIAEELSLDEQDVLEFYRTSLANGTTKRVGMVLNHQRLGYRSNAMVVWNVPGELVDHVGELLGREDKVTLCYQRPRRAPHWPYNLFAMIHGKCRQAVLAEIARIRKENGLENIEHDVLFSTRKFKQTGARYAS
ncbi:AsnC family protein [Aliikangiella sp. G2MR2-5]|uniref:siroheme decarboxylase subunit beta n=1 Tax=Aliikangiella sp. G2MR2-5 TaxID=2788943 RepID=UPI0018AA3F25|nr:AsnC family protein [Aliikangiella sp. G2MR2-5]